MLIYYVFGNQRVIRCAIAILLFAVSLMERAPAQSIGATPPDAVEAAFTYYQGSQRRQIVLIRHDVSWSESDKLDALRALRETGLPWRPSTDQEATPGSTTLIFYAVDCPAGKLEEGQVIWVGYYYHRSSLPKEFYSGSLAKADDDVYIWITRSFDYEVRHRLYRVNRQAPIRKYPLDLDWSKRSTWPTASVLLAHTSMLRDADPPNCPVYRTHVSIGQGQKLGEPRKRRLFMVGDRMSSCDPLQTVFDLESNRFSWVDLVMNPMEAPKTPNTRSK